MKTCSSPVHKDHLLNRIAAKRLLQYFDVKQMNRLMYEHPDLYVRNLVHRGEALKGYPCLV